MYQILVLFVWRRKLSFRPIELNGNGKKYENVRKVSLYTLQISFGRLLKQAVELMDAREETVPHTGKRSIIP